MERSCGVMASQGEMFNYDRPQHLDARKAWDKRGMLQVHTEIKDEHRDLGVLSMRVYIASDQPYKGPVR